MANQSSCSVGQVRWQGNLVSGAVALGSSGQCAASFQEVMAQGQIPEGASFSVSFPDHAPVQAIGIQPQMARTSDIGLLQLLDWSLAPDPPTLLTTDSLGADLLVQVVHPTQTIGGYLHPVPPRDGLAWFLIELAAPLPGDMRGCPVWLGQQGVIGIVSGQWSSPQRVFALRTEELAALHGALDLQPPDLLAAPGQPAARPTPHFESNTFTIEQGNMFVGTNDIGDINQTFGAAPPTVQSTSSPVTPAPRIRSNIFISYRRKPSSSFAQLLRRTLLNHIDGSIFLDTNVLRAGPFDDQLLRNIRKCDVFLLIVSEGTFDRINEPDDWVRQEIVEALTLKRAIIPIFHNGAMFSDDLPDDIAPIKVQQGLVIADNHTFDASINELLKYIQGV